MERLMPEQRRSIEDFEVIEYVDEKQIANLRQRVDVDVPLSLHWTWEYGSEVEELRQLYERGKKGQWNAEEDVDWSTPFPHDQWFLPRQNVLILPTILTLMGADEETCRDAALDEFAWTMSQLLHGEQAALQLCGQLTNACPTMDAKFYAASQVADEARHVEVIAAFQEAQLDDTGRGDHVAAALAYQVDRRLHRAAGRDQVVENDHPLTRGNRVLLHLDRVGAVFEVVGIPHGPAGQLALLADHREAVAERVGERRGDEKPA